MAIQHIRVNGDCEMVASDGGEIPLNKLQELIGGYVAVIPIVVDGVPGQFCCDEDGLLKQLPPNRLASEMIDKLIVGDVVLLTGGSMLT